MSVTFKIKASERGDPAVLRTPDPLVEVFFGKVGILEREYGLEAFRLCLCVADALFSKKGVLCLRLT